MELLKLQMWRVRVYENAQMMFSFRVESPSQKGALDKVENHLRELKLNRETLCLTVAARPAGFVEYWA